MFILTLTLLVRVGSQLVGFSILVYLVDAQPYQLAVSLSCESLRFFEMLNNIAVVSLITSQIK